ncbi:TraB/GumN family protein [Roseovarius salis]|uniref:TraB/GumN family protein n=1 Tax=Roseovarius salis TaxID=3376063 RepID=UPI0037C98BA8
MTPSEGARMARVLALILFMLQPAAAVAERCEGRDLIAALPAPEREALLSRASAAPYDEGLLWRATRQDTEITLFGTYHFRHAKTRAHLDRLKPLIARSDTVYLEMSPQDQERFEDRLARSPSLMFITDGPTLPDLLGDADWQTFRTEMAKRRIPGLMAAKFKPAWAAMMLGIGPCEARNGALEGKGIDELVGMEARRAGIRTRSLERFDKVLGQLDETPLDKQLDMIRLTLDLPADADDMSYTIRERYLREQTALTWEFSRHLSLEHGGPTAARDFARLENVLLTGRNTAWVEKLMAEARGQRVLVAAGAGHLPGEAGLLQLLRRHGFSIRRLPL